MPPTIITYRRAELYDQVWAEPMIHVAKKYGVTSVALAKTCRRLGIPLPGNGYWARLRAGQTPGKRPLPPGKVEELHVVRPEPVPHKQLPPELEEKIARERDPAMRIVVPDKLARPHPLIVRDPRAREWGNKDQRDRAMRIMDALVRALRARGAKVDDQVPERRWDEPSLPYTTVADFDGDRVVFGIEEMYENVLRLLIVTRPGWGTRAEQRDTDKHRIEDTLNRFVIQIYKVAEEVREHRIRDDARQREDAARREREYNERQAQWEFEKRENELLRDVNGWRLAKEIREYVIESLKILNDAGLFAPKGGDLDERLSWAMEYADLRGGHDSICCIPRNLVRPL